MYEIRSGTVLMIAITVLALGTAPDALASKEEFVRDKPHVHSDAAAETTTETVKEATAGHDHGEAKGGGCKMHEMKAGKEGKKKGCKMMQKKQKRMQMKKQSQTEHQHGNEETSE